MLWRDRRESGNVIDQRAFGAKSLGGGGLLIGAVIVYLMGGNPLAFLAQNMDQAQTQSSAPASDPKGDDRKKFVSVVLADTEDVFSALFQKEGHRYEQPSLVLFRGQVKSACGRASSASGPFYCPGDQRLYMDLGFLDELSGTLGAKGEFAGAYVVAHEVGHHVQHQLGLMKGGSSVAVELQADCLAGVWAKQTDATKNVLEPGDVESAMSAASAVGDDRLQKRSQGYVVPDSFTHGSSAQRVAAFEKGFEGGELRSCVR